MPIIKVEKTFEFEVAFSFLEENEGLAYEINDLIQDRFKTFIYSQHQKDLVGKDGSETFRQIFEEKSRIVVVLYKETWGTTFWTRIEEQAIKHRALEESADFTIFISLDGKKPKWLSKTQIWYDFERFGVKSTAAIIEKRVAEYGGMVREESVIDQATRHKRNLIRKKELEKYLLSSQGMHDAQNEIKQLLKFAENNIELITDHSNGISYATRKLQDVEYTCFGKNIGLTFLWKQKYFNSLADSELLVFIADYLYYEKIPIQGREGNIYKKGQYMFYENEAGTKGWVNKQDKKNFYTSEQLVNNWQKKLLDMDKKDRDDAFERLSQYK